MSLGSDGFGMLLWVEGICSCAYVPLQVSAKSVSTVQWVIRDVVAVVVVT